MSKALSSAGAFLALRAPFDLSVIPRFLLGMHSTYGFQRARAMVEAPPCQKSDKRAVLYNEEASYVGRAID